ncbi:hypothetical protein [Labrenzia sp. PHM005]|uniref:hypothetical protein n=1 Tax=Labrenzia sp. PHM005 TaxID=2590016 RepID=UPI0011405FAB|nr:hypothetical protein [Labrenzia sp. PHM005]QDG74392.1 hypothetical protein FJ695_00060 [Labrenzia sp. PHM005]
MTKKSYTEHIGRRAAANVFHAFDFAKNTGHPMNTYTVLHLRDQDSASVTTQFTKIRRKFRNWYSYHQKKNNCAMLPPIYTYTFEAPTGAVHVNWVLHIPDAMLAEFQKKLPKWVEKVTGDLQPYDIKTERITPGTDKRVANYCNKGVDPLYAEHFNLNQISAPQGRIYGRRVTVSTAISKASREAVGFKAKYHRNDHQKGRIWQFPS